MRFQVHLKNIIKIRNKSYFKKIIVLFFKTGNKKASLKVDTLEATLIRKIAPPHGSSSFKASQA